MAKFSEGDAVQVHLPDKNDPDHDRYHGRHGIIVKKLECGVITITGEEKNSIHYRVQFSFNKKLDLPQQCIRNYHPKHNKNEK